MKLYFAPGTCSLSPHILLRETGIPFALERVDLHAQKLADGQAFHNINPKGKVPVLETPNGEVLTEGAVIAQYIAESAGESGLLPPPGTLARYRVLEWQTFVTTELHKTYGPLFNPAVDASAKPVFVRELRRKYEWIDSQLIDNDYLAGEHFTVADAYLYVVSRWAALVGVKIDDLTNLGRYLARISARPAVQAALRAEGLK